MIQCHDFFFPPEIYLFLLFFFFLYFSSLSSPYFRKTPFTSFHPQTISSPIIIPLFPFTLRVPLYNQLPCSTRSHSRGSWHLLPNLARNFQGFGDPIFFPQKRQERGLPGISHSSPFQRFSRASVCVACFRLVQLVEAARKTPCYDYGARHYDQSAHHYEGLIHRNKKKIIKLIKIKTIPIKENKGTSTA